MTRRFFRSFEQLERRELFTAVQLTNFPISEPEDFKSLVNLEGHLYFVAPTGTMDANAIPVVEDERRFGLFRTDGTSTGTQLVKDGFWGEDANDAVGNHRTIAPVTAATRIIFEANDGETGDEVWVTDGTAEGTHLLRDDPDPVCCPPASDALVGVRIPEALDTLRAFAPLVEMDNGELLYWSHRVSGSTLWRTDGTPENTRLVKSIDEQHHGERNAAVEYQGAFYFIVSSLNSGDAVVFGNSTGESHLWRTDGTEDGTYAAAELVFPAGELEVIGDRIYVGKFPQAGPQANPVLQQSDGTSQGTSSLGELLDRARIEFDGEALVFFLKFDEETFFEEVRTLELVGANRNRTELFRNTRDESFWEPSELIAHNGYAYFSIDVRDPDGNELWRTDGTKDGTELVQFITHDSRPELNRLGELNGKVFFNSPNDQVDQVWATDGPSIRLLVDELAPPVEIGGVPIPSIRVVPDYTNFVQLNDNEALFFKIHGLSPELYRTDGENVELVRQWHLPAFYSERRPARPVAEEIIVLDGVAYFLLEDSEYGLELWQSDGTADGTRLVRDVAPGPALSRLDVAGLQRLNQQILYWANDGQHGTQLYATTETPIVSFAQSEVTVFEDGTPAIPDFDAVTLTRNSTVGTSIVEVTFIGATAEPGSDFSIDPLRVTFAPGEAQQELPIPILDDTEVEGTERLSVLVSAVENSVVDDRNLTIRVLDNEARQQPTGDTNADGVVTFADYLAVVSNYGKATTGGAEVGDFDDDQYVGFSDFLAIAWNFGRRVV